MEKFDPGLMHTGKTYIVHWHKLPDRTLNVSIGEYMGTDGRDGTSKIVLRNNKQLYPIDTALVSNVGLYDHVWP